MDDSVGEMFPVSLLYDKEYWIGYRRRGRNFVGVDNETHLEYTNWDEKEPSYKYGSSIEKCVEMYGKRIHFSPGDNVVGRWNDNKCEMLKGYICKMKGDYEIRRK